MPRELDEDDVRTRPNPRGSRPRTRTRPRHEAAHVGFVTAVDRGRYTCLVDGADQADRSAIRGATANARTITAMRARELGRRSVVVGDRVALVGDVSGEGGTLARIVRIEPRRTVLMRTADDTDAVERVVVANADQLVMVVALADPPPRPRLVDRYLVAAYDAGIEPLLCLTKADLAPAEEMLEHFRDLGLRAVTTRPDDDVSPLRELLADRVTVLVGHSGVGKSSLVNRLVPDAERRTGGVTAIGRGRHVSTSVVALPLPGGGWVIDTPGIRSFGLAHVSPQRVLEAFPELVAGSEECPPGCSHLDTTTGCHLDEWVAEGHAGAAGARRLDSYRRLLTARSGEEDA